MRAIAYCRVSTTEQGRGLSLDWQRKQILEEILRRGWQLTDSHVDKASGKSMRRRPGLEAALRSLSSGGADALVVARLDRLSRSLGDFAGLMDRAGKEGWSIVLLDPPVDMTTPFGRAMAGVAGVFAQLESELISQRQRDSYAARRAAGTLRLSPACVSPIGRDVRDRVMHLHVEEGLGPSAIARRLTIEGYPPPNDVWIPRTVTKIIAKEKADAKQGSRSAA